MSGAEATPALAEGLIWHDVENGGYDADLPLWRELAAEARGPVLELGCGSGRVALALAGEGAEVVGVDSDALLIDALNQRAAERGLGARGVRGDVRYPHPPGAFGLVLAPMQLLQLLPTPDERAQALRAARLRLGPGAVLACAIVEGAPEAASLAPGEAPSALPDVAEHHGWVYSSLPLGAETDGESLIVNRLRQRVSPAGEMREELHRDTLALLDAAMLETEAAASGLRVRERRQVGESETHVGSAVFLLEAA